MTDVKLLDAVTRGFVVAMLWTSAVPLAPYNVVGDDDHGWQVLGPDGHVGERFPEFEDANSYAMGRNDEDDNYTGETGGMQDHEPTDELVSRCREVCQRFLTAAKDDDVDAFMDNFSDPDGGHPGEYVGHTFYLTAVGSGVAFTDRAWRDDDPMTAVCARLSTTAEEFGEVEHMEAYEQGDGTVGCS